MKTIDQYAIGLIVAGTQHAAEEDTNEDAEIGELDHPAACDLALRLADAIEATPEVVLALAAAPRLARLQAGIEETLSALDRLRTRHEGQGLFQAALAYDGAAELLRSTVRSIDDDER